VIGKRELCRGCPHCKKEGVGRGVVYGSEEGAARGIVVVAKREQGGV
jgi:hypothetical protein